MKLISKDLKSDNWFIGMLDDDKRVSWVGKKIHPMMCPMSADNNFYIFSQTIFTTIVKFGMFL